MMFQVTQEGDVARITLDRPETRNALSIAGWRTLAEVVAEAGASARVVLLTGGGAVFCAGADLSEIATLAEDAGRRAALRVAMRNGIGAVAACRVPVVAGINGGAYGAGVALALACDVRVACRGARFAVPPARFGIGYPQGDVDRLVATIGRSQAARLLLAAEEIDAVEAARIGLVDMVAEDGGAALAQAIAANVPESVALLRREIAGMDAGEADRAFEDSFGSAAFAKVAANILARRT